MGILAVASVALAACARETQPSFQAGSPHARLQAIVAAAEEGDERAIPHLIEQLGSDDPAVRLLAIRTLERMTGETKGYDHAAPLWSRREAIARWRAWYRAEARP